MTQRKTLDEIIGLITQNTLVLGVGNDIKGDDGIGPWIVSQIEKYCHAIDGKTVPEAFLPEIRTIRPDLVLIIDAAIMGSTPGAVGVFRGDDVEQILFSTHSLPLSMLAKYIEKELDAPSYIIGIEPKSFGFGEPMSKEALEAGESIVSIIKSAIGGK